MDFLKVSLQYTKEEQELKFFLYPHQDCTLFSDIHKFGVNQELRNIHSMEAVIDFN